MFILPKEKVREIVLGKINYDDLPCDQDNELSKGFRLEDQARINIKLAERYLPVCVATEEACKKKQCPLFTDKTGKIKGGWACREFWLNFPKASFDAKLNFGLVGIDKIDEDASKERFKELKSAGGKFVCLSCKRVYEKKPMQFYEDGHGGRDIEMCVCGCDLLDEIDAFIKNDDRTLVGEVVKINDKVIIMLLEDKLGCQDIVQFSRGELNRQQIELPDFKKDSLVRITFYDYNKTKFELLEEKVPDRSKLNDPKFQEKVKKAMEKIWE